MALNFPDNPSDGDEYSASNGVVYTYNASTDTWTGSSAAGDNYWQLTAGGDLTTVDADQNVELGGTLTVAGAGSFTTAVSAATVTSTGALTAGSFNIAALSPLPDVSE